MNFNMIYINLITLIILFFILIIYIYNNYFKLYNYRFIKYTSSKLENEWINLLYKYRNNYSKVYCNLIKRFNIRLRNLQKDVCRCKTNHSISCKGKDLSFFVYEDRNGDRIKEYVEPLFGILRNTDVKCKTNNYRNILSKEYLLPSNYLVQKQPVVYIDAGSSTFYDGAGGSSQSYFYYYYKNISTVKYRKWFLWEIEIQNLTKVRKDIPKDLLNIYNYNNRPINVNYNSHDNPLRYIRKYQYNSYIIFKLDIDTPNIELIIFNNLLKYNDIHPNEFYFEYHFYEPYMMKNGWGKNVDYRCDLYCATLKFLKLRRKGIRSHAWV